MTEIKSFWIEDRPTLEDIEQAYSLVDTGVIVSIRWFVQYNGSHERIITKDVKQKYTPEEYFEKCILHIYGV